MALSELLVTSCGLSSFLLFEVERGLSSFLLFEVEQDGPEGNDDCTGGESALPCVLVLVSCVTASINFAIDGKIEKASVSVRCAKLGVEVDKRLVQKCGRFNNLLQRNHLRSHLL